MFIPVTFETTVLGASLAAVFGMLALNGLPEPYHPLFNNDRFALASRRNRFFLCIRGRSEVRPRRNAHTLLEGLGGHHVTEVPQ